MGAFDFDGDGWPDLYFTQGCPLPVGENPSDVWRDRLYRNVGGSFIDLMRDYGIKELARTGVIAMARGTQLRDQSALSATNTGGRRKRSIDAPAQAALPPS